MDKVKKIKTLRLHNVAKGLIELGYHHHRYDHGSRFNCIIDISHIKGSIFVINEQKWYYFNTDGERFRFMKDYLDKNLA